MSPSLSSATTTTAPLIKGYLPVRLRIPPTPTLKRSDPGEDEEDQYYFEETYFYIREHRGSTAGNDGTDNSNNKKNKSTSSNNNNNNATLFVANAPIIPNVSTKLLLQSIFGRFANVKRVTVVPNPRGNSNEESSSPSISSSISSTEWTPISHLLHPSFLPPPLVASQQEGKFAHVVFATSKDMKQCKKALEHIMSSGKQQQQQQHNNKKKNNNNNNNKDNKFFLQLDELEIQTLADQSLRQAQAQRKQLLRVEHDDDDSDSDRLLEDETKDAATGAASSSTKKRKTPPQTGGVLAVAQRYRDSLQLISRERILQECNAVMAEYEQAEEAKRHAIAMAKTQPDDDGFVTVTYNTAVGSKMDLEQPNVTGHNDHRRKSGQKRSRSRKQQQKKQGLGGAQQAGLPDFYRFQRKEQRQRTMDELRQQFQQDLDRVQRLKEEKQYKPF